MARIRTIKPEFWTSEQVVECSPIARLLFIGLWNFCDDNGNHPASSKTLKMLIFPGDAFGLDAINGWIAELHDKELVFTYQNKDKQFWHVIGWHHQKIEKPNTKYPLHDAEDSTTIRRPFGDHSPPEGKGCIREVEKEGIKPLLRVSEIQAMYQKYAGVNMIDSGKVVVFQDMIRNFTREAIEEAFQAAASANISTAGFLTWCRKRMERVRDAPEDDRFADWK